MQKRGRGFNDFLSNGESMCDARGAAVPHAEVGDHGFSRWFLLKRRH